MRFRSCLRPLLLISAPSALVPNLGAQTVVYDIAGTGSNPGFSVRGLGDVDGDGFPDFAVGSPGTSDGFCNGALGGEVTIYSGRDGSVLRSIQSPPSGLYTSFGFSVGAAGDVNGDGYADIIVGDPHYSSGNIQCGQGRAVVFSGFDGSILYTFYGDGTPSGYELFGWSVAGAGDVNNDGFPDLIVGSLYGLNYNGEQTGYARVYSGQDGSVLYTLYGNDVSDRFGWSVAGAGDTNLDGYADVIVGTPFSNYAGAPGSARLYSGRNGLLLQFFNGLGMGNSVDAAGDVNGDGNPDVVVQGGNGMLVYSGADGTLLFNLPATGLVSGAGDVNGDGHADLIASGSFNSPAQVFSGLNGSVLYNLASRGLSATSAGDLNHDGKSDVIVGGVNPYGHILVYLSGCPTPTTYCTAKLNSIGCLPTISSSGIPSLSVGLDDFIVEGSNVRNNTTGLLFWGLAPASAPFGGGIRCVGPPIHRTGGQNSGGSSDITDCSGVYSFHFSRNYILAHGVSAGTTLYAQYWSRDPGYAPPNNIGLTNAASFTILP